MRPIDFAWFYFEGFSYSHAPFSAVTGKVVYANGEPAKKIAAGLVPAFGPGFPNNTYTDEAGKFRGTWFPSGRHRILATTGDPSIRSYRTWYYPGVADSDNASDVSVAEDESIDVGNLDHPNDSAQRRSTGRITRTLTGVSR
jgi:hypothetical protein